MNNTPARVALALCALAALGAYLHGRAKPPRFQVGRGLHPTCIAPTRVLGSTRETAESPVVYDVDRDGEEELITVQTEPPGPHELGQRAYVVAVYPARREPLWRARIDNVPASQSPGSAAREHLLLSGDRVIHIDLRGRTHALDVSTGRVLSRAALGHPFARACAAPEGAPRLWLDGVPIGHDTMIDADGRALQAPRPPWCPELRERSARCLASGSAADCRPAHELDPEVPGFQGTIILDNGRFAVALGAHTENHRAMAVGLEPSTHIPLWSRELPRIDSGQTVSRTSLDRGEIFGSRVYVPYASGLGFRLAALDLSAGTLAWDLPLPCTVTHDLNRQPTGITATLSTVYLQSRGSTVALDINHGALRWMLSD